MVQRLAGIGDELAGPLTAIIDAIGHITNPDAEFQQQAKLLFLQKPELMQKFVDVEKANPGTLKAFGFGDKGTNLMQGMHESIPALIARVQAPRIAGELQKPESKAVASGVTQAISGQTPGQLEADDVSSWMAKEGLKLFQQDPQSALEVLRAKFGVQSPGERARDAASVPIAQAAGGKAQQELDAFQAAKPFQEMAPMDQVVALAKGTMTGQQVAGILSGPQRLGFDAALELYRQERELNSREMLKNLSNDPFARARQEAAFDSWKAHQGQGTVQGWYNHLWPQNKNEVGASAPGDAGVIANALKDEQFAKRTDQISKMMKAIEPDIKSITEAKMELTPTSVNTRIANINSVLKANNSDWTAVAVPPGSSLARTLSLGIFGGSPRWGVMYKNKAGELTDDPGSLISNVPPRTINPQDAAASDLTGPEQQLVSQLKGLSPDSLKAVVQRLKAKDPNLTERLLQAAGVRVP